MYLINDFIYFRNKLLSPGNNLISVCDQLHIPDIQSIDKLRLIHGIFQKLISLIDDPVIICQIPKIDFIQLGQFQIHESSSFRRAVFDNIQILRRKKHKIHQPKKLTRFSDRNLIDRDSFWTVLLQMHIDLPGNFVLLDDRLDMRLLLSEPDQIPISGSSVRLCRTGKVHSFQDICLSLRIVSVENIGCLIKFNIQQFIISVIFQLQ